MSHGGRQPTRGGRPYRYPRIIGDATGEWQVSSDALTYTDCLPRLCWTRNVVHWAKLKSYVAPPSHFTNQKIRDVWLAED